MIVNIDVVPANEISEIKRAYESAQLGNVTDWYWLIRKFNTLHMGNDILCGTCPDSIAIIREHIPKLWEK